MVGGGVEECDLGEVVVKRCGVMIPWGGGGGGNRVGGIGGKGGWAASPRGCIRGQCA